MALLQLTNPFKKIEEGEHLFTITEFKYDTDFHKVEIKMETSEGKKHTENYRLMNKDGQVVEGAMNALSYFVRQLLGGGEDALSLEEIETDTLVGISFMATVEHTVTESTKDPSKTYTNVRLSDIEVKDAPLLEELDDDEEDDDDLLSLLK